MKTVIDLLDNCHQFIYESENRLQEQHEIEKNICLCHDPELSELEQAVFNGMNLFFFGFFLCSFFYCQQMFCFSQLFVLLGLPSPSISILFRYWFSSAKSVLYSRRQDALAHLHKPPGRKHFFRGMPSTGFWPGKIPLKEFVKLLSPTKDHKPQAQKHPNPHLKSGKNLARGFLV